MFGCRLESKMSSLMDLMTILINILLAKSHLSAQFMSLVYMGGNLVRDLDLYMAAI